MPTRSLHKIVRLWPALAAFVLFLVLWQVASDVLFSDRKYILPDPILIVKRMWEIRADILQSAWETLSSALIGYGLSVFFGILFGMLLREWKLLERSLYPWAVILQVTPIIAIAPLIVIWFGFGKVSIIIIAMLISYFPVLNNTHLGLASTDRNQVDIFRMHRVGRFRTFWKLRLPSAIPSIIGGLRISAGLGITGTVLGEFVIGTAGTYGGLGVRIINAQAALRTTDLFGYVAAASVLGLLFFGAVSYLGNRLLRDWHESAQTEVME